MAEILPGSFAPAQSVQAPASVAVPPPGVDATARTQRATPASQEQEKTGDRRRTIEDNAAQTRADRRRADAADQQSLEQTQREEAERESAVRDRHEVDLRI